MLLEGLPLLLQPPYFAGHDHHLSCELFFELFDVVWITSQSPGFLFLLVLSGFGMSGYGGKLTLDVDSRSFFHSFDKPEPLALYIVREI